MVNFGSIFRKVNESVAGWKNRIIHGVEGLLHPTDTTNLENAADASTNSRIGNVKLAPGFTSTRYNNPFNSITYSGGWKASGGGGSRNTRGGGSRNTRGGGSRNTNKVREIKNINNTSPTNLNSGDLRKTAQANLQGINKTRQENFKLSQIQQNLTRTQTPYPYPLAEVAGGVDPNSPTYKTPLISRIKNSIVDVSSVISSRFPANKEGILGLFDNKRKTNYVVTYIPALGMGGHGTQSIEIRPKNFFEKNNLDPRSADAIKLKNSFDTLQKQADAKIISPEDANKQLKLAVDRYSSAHLIKELPKTAAKGLALAALSAIPVVGQVAAPVFLADMFLKRNALASQIISNPVGSAANFLAFSGGALIGRGVVSGALSAADLSNIKINPENLESVTLLSGQTKQDLIKKITETPELSIKTKSIKGTSTTAFKVITKDNKIFDIVQFGKTKKINKDGSLSGDVVLIGFEKGKNGNTVVGRGVQSITPHNTETYLKAFTFRPKATRLSRLAARYGLADRGNVFEILDKAKSNSFGGSLVRGSNLESRTKILSVKPITGELSFYLKSIGKKLDSGQKIPINEIKDLVNLERKFNGEPPFTWEQFRKAGYETITKANLRSYLQEIKVNTIKEGLTRGVRLREKRIGVGIAFTKRMPSPLSEKVTRIEDTKTGLTTKNFEKNIVSLNRQRLIEKIKNEKIPAVRTKLLEQLKTSPVFGIASALVKTTKRTTKIPLASVSLLAKNAFVLPSIKMLNRVKTQQPMQQINRPKTILRYKSLFAQSTNNKQKITQKQLIITRAKIETRAKQLLRQQLRQQFKQPTKLSIAQRYPKIINNPNKTNFVPPVVNAISGVGGFRRKNQITFQAPIKTSKVQVQIRRRGIFYNVGKPTQLKLAQKNLLNSLDNTLAASGRLMANGRLLKPIDLPRGFRYGKKNPLLVVEKRNKRLSTHGETYSINKAKLVFKGVKKR